MGSEPGGLRIARRQPATRRMCEMRQNPIAINGILSAILPENARPYRIPVLRMCRARANAKQFGLG
jgi:hypothetical protein